MTTIRFVGNRKAGQVRYRSETLMCRLDVPATCLLEVGKDVTEEEALRLMNEHGDLFQYFDGDPASEEKAKAGNLSDLTVVNLKVLAKKCGIDLGQARKKADIIAAIKKAV